MGHLWVQAADFSRRGDETLALLGRARDRFGPAISVLDVNRDGRFDLFLAAAVRTPRGVRDCLLINEGEGRFSDASSAFGLPDDRASLGISASDFDADGFPDVFLTGVGQNVLLRNNAGKSFEDATEALKGDPAPPAVCPSSRWLDLDQDGDLDLIVLQYTSAENVAQAFSDTTPPGLPNLVYRNDGIPPRIATTTPENDAPSAVAPEDRDVSQGLSLVLNRWTGPEVEALLDGDRPHTGVVSLDLDVDRDLDLIFTSDGQAPSAAMNDRMGRFHARKLPDLAPRDDTESLVNGAVVLDLDRDSRSDLVLVRPHSRLNAWRNAPLTSKDDKAPSAPDFSFAFWPIEARLWRSAQAVDLDLDGWSDLLGVRSPETGGLPTPRWARNEGNRIEVVRFGLAPRLDEPLLTVSWIDLISDSRPDLLLLYDGQPPFLASGQDNGNHYLGLDLNGRWKFDFDFMRSNPHGLGTFVLCEGPGLEVPVLHTPGGSSLGQSATPLMMGLGPNVSAALVHVRWPDGVMQAELNLPGDQILSLAEHNRKTGSCPVLFTFDGKTMVCIGDFLGGGGLGYLIAPGVLSQPDRDEAVRIGSDQLVARSGRYRLSVAEPMDELAYLDRITLDVVDAPPGVEAAPEERFAPGGNRPSGALLTWRRSVEPEKA
ncbi:MAG TPA: CRTAC1 family protein, partial [Isosphaeraceae bacterium]|nr:CRTAC1 family protein [Isosphaeraceae bacterium]